MQRTFYSCVERVSTGGMSDSQATQGTHAFSVDVTRDTPDGHVVAVAGDVDLHSGGTLRDRLAALADGGARQVTIDLSEATFLDSMALGVMLGAKKRLDEGGGDLVLVVPKPEIRRIFEITMLDRVFEIHASRDEAVASSGRGPT
jgi:anti-sigma B factor antagonist